MPTPTRKSAHPRKNRRSGFTLMESLLCLLVFGAVLITFSAAFPSVLHTSDKSAGSTQAALVAQHKIDQLRQLGYAQLRDAAALQLLGVIDAERNADGTYTFARVDGLADSAGRPGFFGASGNVATSIAIEPALPGQGVHAPSTLRALAVTVSIQWKSTRARTSACTLHTIVAAP